MCGESSDRATDWTLEESWFDKRQVQVTYVKLADRLWGPPNLLLSGYLGFFPKVQLTTHLHALLRCGAEPPLTSMHCCGVELYLHSPPCTVVVWSCTSTHLHALLWCGAVPPLTSMHCCGVELYFHSPPCMFEVWSCTSTHLHARLRCGAVPPLTSMHV